MKNPFSSFKENIVRYIQLRIATLKLEVVDKASNLMGYFVFTLIIAFLFFFSFLYFSFGLAAWLGDLLGSKYAGMFCTGGIILILTIVVLFLSKPIIRFFAGKIAVLILRKSEQEKDDEEA